MVGNYNALNYFNNWVIGSVKRWLKPSENT